MNDQEENLYFPEFIEINRNWAKEHFGTFEVNGRIEPVRFFGPEYKGRQVCSIAHHEYYSAFSFQCHPDKITPNYCNPIEYHQEPERFKKEFLLAKSLYLKKSTNYTGIVEYEKTCKRYEYD